MKPEIFLSFGDYKAKFFFSDFFSGLLIAIIALPLSIAMGYQTIPLEVSSNGLQMGLITAIVAGLVVAILSGSKFQIGGPTATFVVIIYNYCLDPEIGLLGVKLAMIFAGVLLIILGLVKAGKVMEFIPYPVIVAFMTGVGIMLLAGQIKDFLGINITGKSVLEKVLEIFKNLKYANPASCLIGVIGLIVILVLQKVNRKIPGAFIAIIVCTAINIIMEKVGGGFGVQTIGSKYGDIEASFYLINFSDIAKVNFLKLILPSLSIAALVMIEALLSAAAGDGVSKRKHNPNMELIAQGVANICVSLLGGIPATGVYARTSANISSGAKSPLAGIIHGLMLLIMYLTLMDVVKFIPLPAFAAVLIVVAINISKFTLFSKAVRFGGKDSLIIFVTLLITLCVDLIYGLIAGLALAFFLSMPQMAKKLTLDKFKGAISENGFSAYIESVDIKSGIVLQDDRPGFMSGGEISVGNGGSLALVASAIPPLTESEPVKLHCDVIVKIKGCLHFLSAPRAVRYVKEAAENTKSVTLDLSDVKSMDMSSAQKLACIKKELQDKEIYFIGAKEKVSAALKSAESLK